MSEWGTYWREKRAAKAALTEQGKVLASMYQTRLHITSPFHPAFARGARELGGRWRPRSRVWTFAYDSRRLALELVVTCYGPAALTADWRKTLAALQSGHDEEKAAGEV